MIGVKRKNGQLDSACHKNITIDENMFMAITINSKHIEHTSFGLETNKLQSIEDLQKIIERIDKRQMCQGSTNIEINKTNESLLKTYTYTDNIGILRNNHCPLLLPESADRNNGSTKPKCKFCRKVNQVLNKKKIRC